MPSAAAIPPEFSPFVAEAFAACRDLGPEAVVALTGSRAAGYAGPGSDLDLWLLGPAQRLSASRRRMYAVEGSLFVDRGDMQAHWAFFDPRDLRIQLAGWPDEMLWVLAQARYLYGARDTLERLKDEFDTYPADVVRRKAQWLVGRCRALLSSFPKNDASKPLAGFMICAQIVECLCRLCCIAEYTPFPYTKWLVRAAGQTRLGERVMPLVDAAQEELRLSPLLPVETLAPQWPPRQKLKAAFDRALAQLAAWGWSDEWIEQPWLAVGVTHLRPAP